MELTEEQLRNILSEYTTDIQTQLAHLNESVGLIRAQLEEQHRLSIPTQLVDSAVPVMGVGVSVLSVGYAITNSSVLLSGVGLILFGMLLNTIGSWLLARTRLTRH